MSQAVMSTCQGNVSSTIYGSTQSYEIDKATGRDLPARKVSRPERCAGYFSHKLRIGAPQLIERFRDEGRKRLWAMPDSWI